MIFKVKKDKTYNSILDSFRAKNKFLRERERERERERNTDV